MQSRYKHKSAKHSRVLVYRRHPIPVHKSTGRVAKSKEPLVLRQDQKEKSNRHKKSSRHNKLGQS